MMSGMSRSDGRRLDAPAGLLAADAGHHEVEQDAVDRLHREQLERLLARAREHDVVALAAQLVGELVQVGRAVVDGEDPLRAEQARRCVARAAPGACAAPRRAARG